MKPLGMTFFASLVAAAVFSLPAGAAMYKWVDEHGTTHYGDSVPPRYASRAAERGKPAAQPAKNEPSKAVQVAPSEEEQAKRKAEAKRQLDRQRQDTALLSTYASEKEIELARTRELKRNQDTLKMASSGLARSGTREDQQKLDALMAQGRQETDSINAKFDAQLARYRELTKPSAESAPAAAQTAASR
jgi:predicted phage-related endonuclease